MNNELDRIEQAEAAVDAAKAKIIALADSGVRTDSLEMIKAGSALIVAETKLRSLRTRFVDDVGCRIEALAEAFGLDDAGFGDQEVNDEPK